MSSAVLVYDGDHVVQGARLFPGEQPPGDQPALSQVSQQGGGLVAHPSDENALTCRRRREGNDPSGSRVPSTAGIGSPWGSWSGCPSSSASRSVNLSETACSSFSASSCTSSHE